MDFDSINNGDELFYITSKCVHCVFVANKKRDNFTVVLSNDGKTRIDKFFGDSFTTPFGRLVPRNKKTLEAIKILYPSISNVSYTLTGSELAMYMINNDSIGKGIIVFGSGTSDYIAVNKGILVILKGYYDGVFHCEMNGESYKFKYVVPVDNNLNMLKLEIS